MKEEDEEMRKRIEKNNKMIYINYKTGLKTLKTKKMTKKKKNKEKKRNGRIML